jgi:hypothetical protein
VLTRSLKRMKAMRKKGGAYEVLEENEGDEEEEDEEDLELGEADEAEHLVHRPRQQPGILPPPTPADAPLLPHRSRSIHRGFLCVHRIQEVSALKE